MVLYCGATSGPGGNFIYTKQYHYGNGVRTMNPATGQLEQFWMLSPPSPPGTYPVTAGGALNGNWIRVGDDVPPSNPLPPKNY